MKDLLEKWVGEYLQMHKLVGKSFEKSRMVFTKDKYLLDKLVALLDKSVGIFRYTKSF